MDITELATLKRKAWNACATNEHDMDGWTTNNSDKGSPMQHCTAETRCIRCGRTAHVNSYPNNNFSEVCGQAIETECPGLEVLICIEDRRPVVIRKGRDINVKMVRFD